MPIALCARWWNERGERTRTPALPAENGPVTAAELILRIAGLTLLVVLSAILLGTRPRNSKATAAAWFSASVAAFMLTSMPNASAMLGAFVYPLTALCATHPVWFWLSSKALFSDRPSLRPHHVVALVGMSIAGVLYQWLLPEARLLGVAFGAASLTFACLAPLSVLMGTAGDLDSRRRRIRQWFVPAVALYMAVVVAVQTVVLFQSRHTPDVLVILNLMVIVGVAALAVSTFLRFRVINWLEVTEASPAVALSRLEQSVLARLQARFAAEKCWTRESLTIAELAEILGTQQHVLRRVINQGLGFRNFSDFLHSYRLKEAAERLRDPACARIPVLTIALESGYGSIGPFNRAFKERFGMTPTEFRQGLAVFEIGKNPLDFG
jgi:AraC-like DNA-binding protein